MSNLSLLRSSYSLHDVVCSYYTYGYLPKPETRRLIVKPHIHSPCQRFVLKLRITTSTLGLPNNGHQNISLSLAILIMNTDMHHTYSDLSNFSIGDDEQLYIAAFYTEHIACTVAIPCDSALNHVPISTCPDVIAGGSGVKESITTITPLSHSRTKTRASDLRADFLLDEPPVVRLPLRRFQAAESLVQTPGSHRGPPSGTQAIVG